MKINDPKLHSKKNMFDEDFDLWVLLEQSSFAVARARDLELNHYGLTPAQASVLYTLEKNNGQATQAEISQYTMRQPHSVSTLLNRMTALGLVKKVRESIGNKSRIVITEKGRKLYTSTKKSSIKMIFSILSKEEKEKLSYYLNSVRERARSLLGMDFKPPFLPL